MLHSEWTSKKYNTPCATASGSDNSTMFLFCLNDLSDNPPLQSHQRKSLALLVGFTQTATHEDMDANKKSTN